MVPFKAPPSHFSQLPSQVVDALSLEVFKTRLEQPALVEGGPARGRGWNPMDIKASTNPNQFGIP